MTRIVRQTTCVVCAGMIALALTALPAPAIDINNLPDWVRDSIHPVEIDWSQVYPGLAPAPAWAQDPAAVQEVHPGAGTPQATGIGALSTVSPAGPAGALNVAHPTTAATGGLQTVSPSPLGGLQTATPASGLGGIGGLAPVHPSAAATAGLHEVNPTSAAMTGLHEVKPGSSATAGLEPVSAGPIVGQINRLTPTDTRAQQLLLNWRTKAEYAGMVLGSVIKRDLLEQSIPPEAMVGVLEAIPLAHPMDETYLPVCEVLWASLGENVEACLQLPYSARIYMATYLGVQGRDEEFKRLICSIDDPNNMLLGARLYDVACELLDYRNCSYHLAIWAHKRGADLRGPADQAFVADAVLQSCLKIRDAEVIRRELIPWAEEALERPGAGHRWGYALQSLLWAYAEVGEKQTGVERGLYWLEYLKGKDLGARPQIEVSKIRTARMAAEIGRLDVAAALYQDLIDSGHTHSSWPQYAHVELAALAEKHADAVAPPHGLVPWFRVMSPRQITETVPLGARTTGDITIRGNPTFSITGTASTVAGIRATVESHGLEKTLSVHRIRLEVAPEATVGRHEGTLHIQTNDPEQPVLEGTFDVEVLPPISVRPPRVAFRPTPAGAAANAVTMLQSGLPFKIQRVVVDRPETVQVEQVRQHDGAVLLRLRLSAEGPPGETAGAITVCTDLDVQPSVEIPYSVTITQPQ